MNQKGVEVKNEVTFYEEGFDKQGKKLSLKPEYKDFQKYMFDEYKHSDSTIYIYNDDADEEDIIIDSSSKYLDMLNRVKQKASKKRLKVENVLLFVSEMINQKIQLPQNYESFQKKMENLYQFAKTTKYIYAADDVEMTIDSSSSYDKVLQNLKQNAKTRTLKVKDEEKYLQQQIHKEVELPDDESDRNDQDYNQLFIAAGRKIPCVCIYQGKDKINCILCKGTGLVDQKDQGWYTELNEEFRKLTEKNFTKIKKYIKDNYHEDIKSFNHWIEFQFKLLNFENQKDFYFKCIVCDEFYQKAPIVHVKSKQSPQKPICDKCFQSNFQEGYITLNSNYLQKQEQMNFQEEDELLRRKLITQLSSPPNLMQQSH